MNSVKTRKCPNIACGWQFPISYTRTACRFCGTLFELQVCADCKQLIPTSEFKKVKTGRNAGYLDRRCRSCNNKSANEWMKAHPEVSRAATMRHSEKRRRIAEEKLQKWLESTNLPFKPMTETEWLETCSYFGGCAICGNEHIESRQFLVGFTEGGRYSSWNIFPMCGECAKHTRRIKNPFLWLDKRVGTAHYIGLTEERAEKLINYLILQIEKAGGAIEPKD